MYTVCISTIIGIFSNENRLLEALVFSFTTRILRSMSPTCSLAAAVLISTDVAFVVSCAGLTLVSPIHPNGTISLNEDGSKERVD